MCAELEALAISFFFVCREISPVHSCLCILRGHNSVNTEGIEILRASKASTRRSRRCSVRSVLRGLIVTEISNIFVPYLMTPKLVRFIQQLDDVQNATAVS